jgi:hypothetical protein
MLRHPGTGKHMEDASRLSVIAEYKVPEDLEQRKYWTLVLD